MYRFANKDFGDYKVLSVEKADNEFYTHLALLRSPYTGDSMECWIVMQPTGDTGVDRFLLVKEDIEYVQDEYV